jgi:GTPase involved in cell partitioning and DNA repair
MLAHLVSFENTNMLKSYKEIRKELGKYDKKLNLSGDSLSEKKEIIILTKADAISDPKIITKQLKAFQKLDAGKSKKRVFILSLFDDEMVKDFIKELIKILKSRS